MGIMRSGWKKTQIPVIVEVEWIFVVRLRRCRSVETEKLSLFTPTAAVALFPRQDSLLVHVSHVAVRWQNWMGFLVGVHWPLLDMVAREQVRILNDVYWKKKPIQKCQALFCTFKQIFYLSKRFFRELLFVLTEFSALKCEMSFWNRKWSSSILCKKCQHLSVRVILTCT